MFIRGFTTEPGVVPRRLGAGEAEPESGESIPMCGLEKDSRTDPSAFYKERLCSTCLIQRPPKASHCS